MSAQKKFSGSGARTPEQVREHYDIEKVLAEKLRSASREERRALYTAVYDELFKRLPHHPQLTHKADPAAQARVVGWQMRFLKRFLQPDSVYLEVGPGDCAVVLEVAKSVKQVYAVDVSNEITKRASFPRNFELALSDGCSIPVPLGSVDVAYSNQLMEHLHPDDAMQQLKNIYDSLAPGGHYICITPSRLTGPHDVSRYFDDVATGLHLKEYTATELDRLFRQVGFSRIAVYVGMRGWYLKLPLLLMKFMELLADKLPAGLRKKVMRKRFFRMLFGTVLVAVK